MLFARFTTLARTPGLRPVLLRGFHALQWANHWRRNVIKTVGGITYDLDLNEVIDSSIYFLGVYERQTSDNIRALCQPGFVVLDIGANVGCHALPLAKLVGSTGKVIAFEPTSWAFKKLSRNAALNPWATNLKLENLGVSDSSASSKRISFTSSWRLFGPSWERVEELRDFVTIDRYVQLSGLETVNLIKIDVDGYELKVLRGALQTLKDFHPYLVMELGTYTLEAVGDTLEQLLDLLCTFNYSIREDTGRLLSDPQEVTAAIPRGSTINVTCR